MNIHFFYQTLLFILAAGLSVEKKLFHDLLTNDNELLYIEDQAANSHMSKSTTSFTAPTSKTSLRIHLVKRQIGVKTICTPNKLTQIKIALYERFDGVFKQNKSAKISRAASFCQQTVLSMFKSLDNSTDNIVSAQEWSLLSPDMETECFRQLFDSCDSNRNKLLTSKELCSCFGSIQSKCQFIRHAAHNESRKMYLIELEDALTRVGRSRAHQLTELSKRQVLLNNYVPLCDTDGYFMPLQCDRDVTCWCVDKHGSPKTNSLSFLSNAETVNC